jgi:surface polysaccharide O-acyltransferase-like enzyme
MTFAFLPEQLSILFLAAIIVLTPRFRETFFALPSGGAPPVEPRERNNRLDAAKAIAISAVIIVHGAYFFTTEEPETLPAAVRIFNNLFRFAVPWFLIVTGIVLAPHVSTGKDIFRFWSRRFFIVGIPYLGMTLLIAFAMHADASTALSLLATGKASVPYYYVLVLLQCYIFFPLLSPLRQKRWFLPSAFFFSLASFLAPHTWYIMGFPTAWQYLFFFCFGMSIRRYILTEEPLTPKTRTAWSWIALLGAISLAALPTLAYNASFFYGPALLMLFLALPPRFFTRRFSLLLARLGTTTFFVYLTHFFVISAVYWFFRKIPLPDTVRFSYTLTFSLGGSMLLGYLYDIIRRL